VRGSNTEIAPQLGAIIEKCLALHSKDRYSRAEDVVVAIEKWQSSIGSSKGAPSPTVAALTGIPGKTDQKPDDYLAAKYAELLADYPTLLSLIQSTIPGLTEAEQQRGAFELLCGQIWMVNLFIPKHRFNMRTFERSQAQALAYCLEGPHQNPCVAELALTASAMDPQEGSSILALHKDYNTYYRGPHLRNLHGQIVLRLLEFESSSAKLAKQAVATDVKDFVRRILIEGCLPRVKPPGSSEEQEKACNRLLLIVVAELVDKSDRTVVSSMEILMEEVGKHNQAPAPGKVRPEKAHTDPHEASRWFGCMAALLVTGLVVLGFILNSSKTVLEADRDLPLPPDAVATPSSTPEVTPVNPRPKAPDAMDQVAKARASMAQKDFNGALARAETAVTMARKGLSVTNLVESLACRAAANEKLGHRDKAIADYEELRKLQPDDAEFRQRLAACKKMRK
jgi:tetratricopeptide (TPR) repeat protein